MSLHVQTADKGPLWLRAISRECEGSEEHTVKMGDPGRDLTVGRKPVMV